VKDAMSNFFIILAEMELEPNKGRNSED